MTNRIKHTRIQKTKQNKKCNLSVRVHANPSPREGEVGGSRIQDHTWLWRVEASLTLGYVAWKLVWVL